MLIDTVKTSLRLTSSEFDEEAEMLIDGALRDMERAGVDPALLELNKSADIDDPLVKTAVTVYCKAHFGYDNPEADRFIAVYERIVCDLLNSASNIAAQEEDGGSEEESGEAAEAGVSGE